MSFCVIDTLVIHYGRCSETQIEVDKKLIIYCSTLRVNPYSVGIRFSRQNWRL